MRFIHSNKQYIERTMYPINPYMNAPAVVPLTMEAFVAPANFDPDAQELNIVKAFAAYPDANKKYIFSVGTSATTVLPAVTGRSYAYSENGGAYTSIASGTVTWTVGSTKRNVVVIDVSSTIEAVIPNGGVWVYISSKVYSISSRSNSYIKYIHCQDSKSITSILGSSFFGCSGLAGVLTIPSMLITLGNGTYPTFYGCNFSQILSNNSKYIVDDNVLYEVISPDNYITVTSANQYVGTLTLHQHTTEIFNNTFDRSKRTGSLTIPNSVTTIASFAFSGCSGFTGSLTIPNSVTSIGSSAFNGCSGFTGTLTIPNSVTNIGDGAFNGCSGFTGTLTIPNSVTNIGSTAFRGCSKFTGSLTIPNSVTTIGSRAFSDCLGLTGSLTIPNSVTTIASFAFSGCSGFTGSLIIPNSVTSISDYAFSGCSGFTDSLTIPNSVTSIGSYAFRGCSGLTGSLTIPNSVTSISDYAFSGCSGILMIDCYKLIPIPIFIYSFGLINKTTCILHVPVGSLAAYQAAAYWNEFTNIIDDL